MKGMWTWRYREKSDQRQQAAQDQGDPTLDVEQENPTHAELSPLS